MTELDPCVNATELASLYFDQWILTVSLRTYSSKGEVNGMVALVFTEVRGFRYLDEGDMLNYLTTVMHLLTCQHTVFKDGQMVMLTQQHLV